MRRANHRSVIFYSVNPNPNRNTNPNPNSNSNLIPNPNPNCNLIPNPIHILTKLHAPLQANGRNGAKLPMTGFEDPCIFVLDLETKHPDARGFRRGFTDMPYAYLSPSEFSVAVRLGSGWG